MELIHRVQIAMRNDSLKTDIPDQEEKVCARFIEAIIKKAGVVAEILYENCWLLVEKDPEPS